MRSKPALTLIELMITIAIAALIGGMGLVGLGNMKSNQALIASADELKSILNRAHISAREGRDEKAWGVKNNGDNIYYLMSGKKTSNQIVGEYTLETPTKFKNGNFELWFGIGTGESSNDKDILLTNPLGRVVKLEVNKNGVITVKNL